MCDCGVCKRIEMIKRLILILAVCILLNGCQKGQENTVITDNQPIVVEPTIVNDDQLETDSSVDQVDETNSQLTTEEKIEDFETLYEIIKDNYAFLDVNKRLNGIDWLENKSIYYNKIFNTTSDEEFYKQLESILGDLNNRHTCMMNRETVLNCGIIYKSCKDNGYWQGMLFDELCKPEVLKRYQLKHEDYENGNETYYGGNYSINNLSVNDIIEGKIASITIPSMISYYLISKDEKILKDYLEKIKEYQALIIDIRGNGGGDSSYFTNFFYPLIIPETMKSDCYLFYKNGSYVQKCIDLNIKIGNTYQLVKEMDLSKIPKLPDEVAKDFTYCNESSIIINPAKDGVNYQGNVYLLVDEKVYSSAEMMAIFSKDSGFATLIGETTGGDGLGSDPIIAALPNSGYVFKFSAVYGTSMDGSCNEEMKTQPHYEVDNPKKTGNALYDECIQKVLELEGLN